ncbi:hypothetical protein PoB_003360900 [Plakobranchus ocellatus]|uniref:Uncharacterized protein n=1 Tax=Plakobranchus ocellatus TaxID=259542 RepID=A0AAV4AL89_9GAST|nr:hypothetical protein PoB_003360900 [Plakobranchus ocellatus]
MATSAIKKNCTSNIPENSVIFFYGFCRELYIKAQDAPQDCHWDNQQTTIHPIVATNRCNENNCLKIITGEWSPTELKVKAKSGGRKKSTKQTSQTANSGDMEVMSLPEPAVQTSPTIVILQQLSDSNPEKEG